MDNNDEIFKNHLASMSYIKGEECSVLGFNLGSTVNVLSHMMTLNL
jgi:hypothetical protein